MKLLMVASECVPFVKTGGLADVVGALPTALAQAGAQVRVVLPLYRDVPTQWRAQMSHVLYFYVNLGWRHQYCGVEKLELEGITYYFVDNEYYFKRPYVYGLGGDEGERFAFFNRAVLEMLPLIDFQPDLLHVHDWQGGMIPFLLRTQYARLPYYGAIRTVFTIHNLRYQGIFPIDQIEDYLALGPAAYLEGGVEFYGQCSFMKAALNWADCITTVSPTYAQEIQTEYYGERLDGLLRARADRLTGILNGIDLKSYDPQTDPAIEQKYSSQTLRLRRLNKSALQAALGLPVDEATPMIGMVGRLSGQKGLDLVEHVLPGIMDTGVQLVILGKGEAQYEAMLHAAQARFAGALVACIEMNEPLSRRIYASSDMFLMPSQFEPCGLSQLIALRYGSLPIVRETGGLRDTVLAYNPETHAGNGFTFLNYNAHDMLHVIKQAVAMYREDRKTWIRLMRRAMEGTYGWDESAKAYLQVYRSALGEEAAE